MSPDGVVTYVAITAPSANAPDKAYNLSEFKYNKENDTYTCPAEQELKTNGNWYLKRVYRVKQYKTPHCKECVLRKSCTISKSGRIIERHEFAESLERNKRAQEERPDVYKQRQSIVEHPFGTMKRSWGYDHIMTKKTKKHASADVGFIFIAYNLRRLFNILGIKELKKLFGSICGYIDKQNHSNTIYQINSSLSKAISHQNSILRKNESKTNLIHFSFNLPIAA